MPSSSLKARPTKGWLGSPLSATWFKVWGKSKGRGRTRVRVRVEAGSVVRVRVRVRVKVKAQHHLGLIGAEIERAVLHLGRCRQVVDDRLEQRVHTLRGEVVSSE